MTRGQDDELGVCCHCFPYPQCGYWCDVTDVSECNAQGGQWIGPQQNNDCEFCEGLCDNCQGDDCSGDSQCPEGTICVLGRCVVNTTNTEACNRDGQPNCDKVVHVKRPYYSDGTPAYAYWGVAIWHPPCDSDCDGSNTDDGPTDQDGDFVIENEDIGPIRFELKNDIYDEDDNPIGKYGDGCCCERHLIVAVCGQGPKCINLDNLCPELLPEWNPQEGEVLVLRGKEGTAAEGFCGYSIYNFLEDFSQRYGTCGNPVYEWVLNNSCKYGVSHLSPPFCEAEDLTSAGVQFCDLDVEVFQVPDPEWVYGSGQRLCRYACHRCHSIYAQCGGCDGFHPEYLLSGGRCIGYHLCEFEEGGVNDDNYHRTPTYPSESPCKQGINEISNDCMERIDIITSQEFAASDYYWNLPWCMGSPDPLLPQYSPDPCGECNWLLLTRCNCSNCGYHHPEYDCEDIVFTHDWHEDWNNSSVLRVLFAFDDGQTTHIAGCFTNSGIVFQSQIPSGAVYTTFIQSGNAYRPCVNCPMVWFPTDSCEMFSPCCPSGGSPNYTAWDCISECPSWACDEEYQHGPIGTCLYCCDCSDIACETSPNDCPCVGGSLWGGPFNSVEADNRNLPVSIPQVNFTSLELYPDKIDVLLPIDLPTIKTEVPVTFIIDSPLPMVSNPTLSQIETYNAMRPDKYVPSFDTQKLGKTIRTGSFADSRMGVPQVNEAHYLGVYTDGSTEWSAWLTFTNCSGVNSEISEARHFSFTYTIFAYCQSGDCKLDSKVIEKKTVQFFMDARIGDRS